MRCLHAPCLIAALAALHADGRLLQAGVAHRGRLARTPWSLSTIKPRPEDFINHKGDIGEDHGGSSSSGGGHEEPAHEAAGGTVGGHGEAAGQSAGHGAAGGGGEGHAAAGAHGGAKAVVSDDGVVHVESKTHTEKGRPTDQDAHAVAVGMLATVTVFPIVISMALSEGRVHEFTLKMLDTFISIFLAILWFNTFRQFLETFEVAEMFPYARDFFSMIQVVVLYTLAMFIAWLCRDDLMRVSTFCACGAHFIAFAGISASAEAQASAAALAGEDFDESAVFGFILCAAFFLGMMFLVNHLTWRNKSDSHQFNEAVDELELDVVGLVVSFVATQAIRFELTGTYPSMHLLLLLRFTTEHPAVKTEKWQRWFMFFWALGLAVVAFFVLPVLNRWVRRTGYTRWVHVIKVILIMMVAWGFLLWGQWEFHEHLFKSQGLFGHMLFSITATLVCLGVLAAVAKVGECDTLEKVQTSNIITTGVALVAAWSWEHGFNEAFDIIGHEYQVGYKGLVPKLVLSIVVPAAILPVYLTHVRPRVLRFHQAHSDLHLSQSEGKASTHSA